MKWHDSGIFEILFPFLQVQVSLLSEQHNKAFGTLTFGM